MSCRLARALCLGLATSIVAQDGRAPDRAADADRFFTAGTIPTLRIGLTGEDRDRLRQEPRNYVACTIREDGGGNWDDVRIKLKGAAGSFREIDDRPALTIKLDRKQPARFHGLAKFHLNNSVQDETWLHEWLAADLLARAGVPAPRVAHARVVLGDRDLGLYVLKEGFDEDFLQARFGSAKGNLYEGGFCGDLDGELELDAGPAPADRRDLAAVVAACHEPDLELAWPALAKLVDLDALLTFTAMEGMLGHWDGYVQNRNNYRVFVPADRPLVFLPHGLDQVLGDPEAPLDAIPAGMVARVALHNPAWRQRLRERQRALLPLFAPEPLLVRVRAAAARLQACLSADGAETVASHRERIAELEGRILARARALGAMTYSPVPEPRAFDAAGVLRPELRTEHHSDDVQETTDGDGPDAVTTFASAGAGNCRAAVGADVVLPRGRYAFRAEVQVEDVAASGEELRGVWLTAGPAAAEPLAGTAAFRTIGVEFAVPESLREVALRLEVGCARGKVSIRRQSVCVERLPQ